MKKIGIATFHYADNYGAVLQAYALRKTINGFDSCQAELINYVPNGYEIFPYEASAIGISCMRKKNKVGIVRTHLKKVISSPSDSLQVLLLR